MYSFLVLLFDIASLHYCIDIFYIFQLLSFSIGPRQANLVLIAYASSEGSGEPAYPRSLARTPRCSLIQAVSQEEPSDRKPDPWPL